MAGYERGPPGPSGSPPPPCLACEVGKVKNNDGDKSCGECGGGRTTVISGASNSSSDCGKY